ncbi:ankyrin repeat-containing protein At5g02620-like [Herrania umbratica]|uniref:Ankyrin repeat-containing protein At5g02620-like n=1 Tax=Herrania umbratica TaxID=108875 RepID=A0A6J1AP02_9ROSI|nr:ankyrin repeat-containing protein At5g02620-like [Herrania umbratica]
MNPDLFSAARWGFLDTLNRMIGDSEGNILEQTTPVGNTALHIVARFGHKHLAEEIIKKRPSLMSKSNLNGETPVHLAARAGRHEVFEIFINAVKDSPEVDICSDTDRFGDTPLHGAVRNGHFKILNALTQRNLESLLKSNAASETPLSIAIDLRLTNIAAKIITLNQSTLGYLGDNGQKPLHYAVMRQDFGIMNIIIGLRNDSVRDSDNRNRTPLHYAAALGHQRMVEELIEKDPSVAFAEDVNKQIPLHLAAENGHARLIETLLKHSPDIVEKVDNKQQNILHIAAKNGNVKVVSYILKLPEMEDLVNSPDVDGNTPLHLAASNYHSNVVGILTKNSKVEIRALNYSGNTALAIVRMPENRGMELEKHLTLKILKAAYKNKAINPEDLAEDTQFDEVEVEKSNKSGEKSREIARTITVMSTVIATFTFTAAFTLPGGFQSDGAHKGMATLITKSAFKAFIISDSIAMSSSLTAAVIMLWSSSLRDTESFMDMLPLAIALTWISLVALAVAFVTGLFVVLQEILWLAILVCVIGGTLPFLVYIVSPTFFLVLERSRRRNIVEDNSLLFTVGLMKIFGERLRNYF